MSDNTIECATHGRSRSTAVCAHVAETLNGAPACGFNWIVDEDDEFQAFCDKCWNASDAEWDAHGRKLITILCEGCFFQAADRAGVDVPREE